MLDESDDLWLVATGAIGRRAMRIGRCFGMDLLAFDVEPDDDLHQELDLEYVPMERLPAESDVVTLHEPGTDATHHRIAQERFEQMKPDAILISTSRGGVVDTRALLRALSDRTVAGAGIDVVEEEPVVREEAGLTPRIERRTTATPVR